MINNSNSNILSPAQLAEIEARYNGYSSATDASACLSAYSDRATLLADAKALRELLTEEGLAVVMADAQWLKKHPGAVPPMWLMISISPEYYEEATHFWRKAIISARAILAHLGLTGETK